MPLQTPRWDAAPPLRTKQAILDYLGDTKLLIGALRKRRASCRQRPPGRAAADNAQAPSGRQAPTRRERGDATALRGRIDQSQWG
jgi:hypothetical protein